MPTERRLAAIMFTDIVGSTAVAARSEAAGIKLRDRHRELVRTQVERYHGRVIEAVGDESLSTFDSAVDAVHTALAVQQELDGDAELLVRIGIHTGETMFRGDEVFGDGVNIAARRLHDVEAVVDAVGADRFTLYALSTGRPIGIAYAVRHPKRVSRLVLAATWASTDPSRASRSSRALATGAPHSTTRA